MAVAGWSTGFTPGALNARVLSGLDAASETIAERVFWRAVVTPDAFTPRRYDYEARREVAEATAVARELLREHLSEEQRALFDERQFFYVVPRTRLLGTLYPVRSWAQLPAYFYKVTVRPAYNVDVYDGTPAFRGRLVCKLCTTQRDEWIPVYDKMLADKLLLELDEAAFLGVANVDFLDRE